MAYRNKVMVKAKAGFESQLLFLMQCLSMASPGR
jgi:hypothetical protein